MGTDGQRLVGGKAEVLLAFRRQVGQLPHPAVWGAPPMQGRDGEDGRKQGKEEKEGKLGWRHPGPAHTYSWIRPPTRGRGSGRARQEDWGQEELVRIGIESANRKGGTRSEGSAGTCRRTGDEELRLVTTLSRSRSGDVEQKKASAASSLRHTAASAASSLRAQRPPLAP
jgi:hypothetical protein